MTVIVPMKMHHRIKIQARIETRGTMGGIAETWSVDDTVWANVRPISGNEQVQAGQVIGSASHLVQMRHNVLMTPKKRIQYDIVASVSDYKVTGSPWKTITSATAAFNVAMVGRIIVFTSGGELTVQQDFLIVGFTDVQTITVDQAVAPADVTNGVGYISRVLHVQSVINVDEEGVVTECLCTEKAA